MHEKMTHQDLRDRFRLPEKKEESVSRAIRDVMDTSKIKQANPEQGSVCHLSHVPLGPDFLFRR
jgi:predicted HTH transcriptional regulator